MAELSMGKVVFILAAINLFSVLAVLFGVFLGGFLVYKTKYSGAELFKQRMKVEAGEAIAAPGEFDGFEALDQLNDELFMPDPRDTNVAATDKTEQALQNILNRNQDFMAKGGIGATTV